MKTIQTFLRGAFINVITQVGGGEISTFVTLGIRLYPLQIFENKIVVVLSAKIIFLQQRRTDESPEKRNEIALLLLLY